jgi:hypothetical protein
LDFQITSRARALIQLQFDYAPEFEIFGKIEAEKEEKEGKEEWEKLKLIRGVVKKLNMKVLVN